MKIGFRDGAWAECINHGCRCVAYFARRFDRVAIFKLRQGRANEAQALAQRRPGKKVHPHVPKAPRGALDDSASGSLWVARSSRSEGRG
jgi:hypothetical protein